MLKDLEGRARQTIPPLDRTLYRQGRAETAELLSSMKGVVKHPEAAISLIERLRVAAKCKPPAYAAGVESILVELEELMLREDYLGIPIAESSDD